MDPVLYEDVEINKDTYGYNDMSEYKDTSGYKDTSTNSATQGTAAPLNASCDDLK